MTRIVLATLSKAVPISVLAFRNAFDYENFEKYCKDSGYSMLLISAEDAAKILVQQGGVGCGVFTLHDAPEGPVEAYRRSLARSEWLHLADRIGLVTEQDPVEVDFRNGF